MRIATNISEQMVPDWTVSQAIAEFLQNALDTRNAGASMTITRDGSMLAIADSGPGLKRCDLALGVSRKDENAGGQFGLGMKEAWLVLVRAGRAVRVVTRGMSITPSLADVGLDVSCLVLDLDETDDYDGTRVAIECTPEEQAEAQAHFVEWQPVNWVDQKHGLSLPGGSVYVNGVLCGALEDAIFSYHLTGEAAQKLNNSDRHAVDAIAAGNLIARIMPDINQQSAEMLLPRLASDRACWEQSIWVNWLEAEPWTAAIHTVWGNQVVMTDSTANVDQMRYMGYTPVQPCSRWRRPLAALCTPLNEVMAALAKQARVDADLTHREREVLRAALDRLARRGVEIDPAAVHVARSLVMDGGRACEGLRVGQEIWLAASVLRTARTAIPVLVHEYAHLSSGADDCSAEFETALLDIGMKLAFGGD